MTKTYVNSNLTPREAFNFHGTLPPAMIEKIIDELEDAQHPEMDVEKLRAASALIADAVAGLCDDCEEVANAIRRALRIIDGEIDG